MALPEREGMDFDVVIVGAGPAGLAAAIRLKQLSPDLAIVVVEKGSEVGAHILSGAVIDPIGLDRLLPDWREDADRPLKTEVARDEFLFLTKNSGLGLPGFAFPKFMGNHGNFVGSLSNVTKYLGRKAEEMGVEIYPGFPASEALYDDNGAVVGIATGDLGIGKSGEPRDDHTRGMELRGKYVVFAEGGPRLADQVPDRAVPARQGQRPPEIRARREGAVAARARQVRARPRPAHDGLAAGQPGRRRLVALPFRRPPALGRLRHAPELRQPDPVAVRGVPALQDPSDDPGGVRGAKRIGYGARAIMEGGWQSVPRLVFPGGCLVGCGAGFVNVPRIKGSHNAVLSGMQAAQSIAAALAAGRQADELTDYEAGWRDSDIGHDLKRVRNVKPLWSRYGTLVGVGLGGVDMWANAIAGVSPFGTLKHGKPDHATTKPIAEVTPIVYPKPDGKLTFDRLSSVYLSNTNHEEDQPPHLHVGDMALQKTSEHDVFGGPSARYCPAGVYEWVADSARSDGVRYQINAQNCVHCKTCDIKDPNQNINWVTPEGPGGPNYPNM